MALKIIAKNVTKIFPSPRGRVIAVKDFNIEVNEGVFLCVVGPSGCGKSTFLRILAGLVPPSSGEVRIIPGKKGVGYITWYYWEIMVVKTCLLD